MPDWGRPLVLFAAATAAAVALCPCAAGDRAPAGHAVRYVVTAQRPTNATLYYRDTEPPGFAEYSHDPYQFSPSVQSIVGPGAPWVMTATLADPDEWAMVAVSSGVSVPGPQFHCELSVDGAVVATGDGARGALCSVRPW